MREAMTVERLLIWTYQDQQVDAIIGRGGAWGRIVGIDSARRAGDRLALGCEVMGGGYARLTVHPDAEAIHDAVRALPGRMIGLVIGHAKAGTRPDWMEGEKPRVYPIYRENGKVMVERDPKSKGRELWCPFRIVPLPSRIAFQRAVYTLWWDALDAIASSRLNLEDHKMLPMGEPREPWILNAA